MQPGQDPSRPLSPQSPPLPAPPFPAAPAPLPAPSGGRSVSIRGHGPIYLGCAVVLVLGLIASWTALDPSRMVGMGEATPVGRIIMGVIGAVLVVIGLVLGHRLAFGAHRMPRYAIDRDGIRLWSPTGSAEIPWQRVVAVGVGWKRSPVPTQLVRLRQGFVLEVFVGDADPTVAYPHAGRLWVTEEPPAPGLPPHRLRLPLAQQSAETVVAQQVRSIAPERFLGSYQREWHRMPGR